MSWNTGPRSEGDKDEINPRIYLNALSFWMSLPIKRLVEYRSPRTLTSTTVLIPAFHRCVFGAPSPEPAPQSKGLGIRKRDFCLRDANRLLHSPRTWSTKLFGADVLVLCFLLLLRVSAGIHLRSCLALWVFRRSAVLLL